MLCQCAWFSRSPVSDPTAQSLIPEVRNACSQAACQSMRREKLRSTSSLAFVSTSSLLGKKMTAIPPSKAVSSPIFSKKTCSLRFFRLSISTVCPITIDICLERIRKTFWTKTAISYCARRRVANRKAGRERLLASRDSILSAASLA